MVTKFGVVGPAMRLEFRYDYMGRRIRKNVYNAITGGTLQESRVFLYEGWNLIAEFDGSQSNALLRTYTWGLDLSGSRHDAGGTGGLLIVQDHEGTSPENHFAPYDGNGNVVGLIDSVTGEKSATYEYSLFGELIRVSGEMGMKNTLRYSSRYTDDETGLLYYGYLYYSPALGKWLSPDPIEERGGMNVFGFLGNDPVNAVDVLGMFGSGGGNWWPGPRPNLPDPSKPIPDDLTRDELEEQQEAYRDIGEGEIKSLEFAEAATWFAIDIIASEEGVRAIQNGQLGVAAKVFATDAVVGKAFKLVKYVKKVGDFVRCCDTYAVSFKKIPEEKVDISGSTSLCSNAPRGVGTAADDAAFWSGRAGANRSAAEASGLTTLERTPAGRALDAQDLFSKLPYDEAIVPWENLSRQFAREASGNVNAWTGGASPTSVWSSIEKPALMLNPNVNKIIINDATQPWKTKIIYK